MEKNEAQVLAGISEFDRYRIGQNAVEVHDIGRRLTEIRQDLESRGLAVTLEQDDL